MPGPSASASAHQVLVYSGPGVSPLSLSHTILTLSLLLLPHYTVQAVTADLLSNEPWEPSCALLVIPGGRDLPLVELLSIKTHVGRRIEEYVGAGGRYLGICSGAYFASGEVRFDVGGPMEVKGSRELAFYPGICEGPTYSGFAYATESGARAVSLILEGQSSGKTLSNLYYNGGGHFLPLSTPREDVEVLARYGEPSTSGKEHPVAVVLANHGQGQGRALLSSVHFEYPLSDPPATDAIAKLPAPPAGEDIDTCEKERIAWVRSLLQRLGLRPPTRDADGSGNLGSGNGSEGGEDPGVLLHPTHPSPIFVFPSPLRPELGGASFASPALERKIVSTEGSGGSERKLQDANDELRLVPLAQFGEGSSSGIASELSRLRRTPPKFPDPPSIESLSLDSSSDKAPPPPVVPDFHSLPKLILLPSPEQRYSPSWTPLFNFEAYWEGLASARTRFGKVAGKQRATTLGDVCTLGDLVWYAETVTSTQTMLDRNPLLLQHLPTPLAFLASFQLSGRGRGSNIWLSPPGCLQYSLLLTLPNAMSSKLVFVQYLMALAVCEAVDEDGRLGVKIKWPNDLYAEVEGVGGTEVGGGKKGRAKLGGILVNTNYIGGQWRLVVGCGINVLNALPTTSLSQLHTLLSARSPTTGRGKPLPAAPTMEDTFAKIMNSFESKWDQFVSEKGFEGFMDEYHSRWLHSDQEVTLTTTTPPTKLRIQSITPDHGLLRCVPISPPAAGGGGKGLTPLYTRGDFGGDDRSSSASKQEYVDLQPDGNSFDLMSGLIKRKT